MNLESRINKAESDLSPKTQLLAWIENHRALGWMEMTSRIVNPGLILVWRQGLEADFLFRLVFSVNSLVLELFHALEFSFDALELGWAFSYRADGHDPILVEAWCKRARILIRESALVRLAIRQICHKFFDGRDVLFADTRSMMQQLELHEQTLSQLIGCFSGTVGGGRAEDLISPDAVEAQTTRWETLARAEAFPEGPNRYLQLLTLSRPVFDDPDWLRAKREFQNQKCKTNAQAEHF